MKFGKLPEGFRDGNGNCPFDALEKDDYFILLNYNGSCNNCGSMKLPDEIWVIFQRTDQDWHVFKPMEDLRCGGCGGRVGYISVMCGNARLEVTEEFRQEFGKEFGKELGK